MKSSESIISLLRNHKPDLLSKYPINQIALFGSYSRGDYNSNSDVDILVDFSDNLGIRFIDLADELAIILNLNVDLVSAKGIKDKYFRTIEKELIYV